MPLGTEVGLGPGQNVLDGDPAAPPTKGAYQPPPPFSGLCLLWPNCRPSQQLLLFFVVKVDRNDCFRLNNASITSNGTAEQITRNVGAVQIASD